MKNNDSMFVALTVLYPQPISGYQHTAQGRPHLQQALFGILIKDTTLDERCVLTVTTLLAGLLHKF